MVGPDPPVSHISLKYDSIKIKVKVRSLTKLAMQQLCKTSFYPVAVCFLMFLLYKLIKYKKKKVIAEM